MSNIRDRALKTSSEWDYDFLNDCWPGSIRPTDVDGLVEIGGRFLFMEFKKRSASLTRGQRILFENLIGLGAAAGDQHLVTVFVIWGDAATQAPTGFQHFPRPRIPCDQESLRQRCRDWAQWARRQRAPTREAVDAKGLLAFAEECRSLDLINEVIARLESRARELETGIAV